MSGYKALYREYRPQTFSDVVGQEHILRVMSNAIKTKRVGHAYLFAGPRGTGKTTVAKVLAKALNCEDHLDYEPCNQCATCRSVDVGSSMEVHEIDAASNRGIDEIRSLRENVNLSAGCNKFKVYIIDEVHMLTTEAFNALLKTLEEPPDKVVFILATTEVHKLPATILSRVQRYEFQRIPVGLIVDRLRHVCSSKDRDVTEGALQVISQKSEGGLRDALGILDQCLLLDEQIDIQQVYEVLGMQGGEFSIEMVTAFINNDYSKALALLESGVSNGRDPRQLVREIIEHLRQVLMLNATGKILTMAPHIHEKAREQNELIDLTKLLRWIATLLKEEGDLKYATNSRLACEILIVKTIYEGVETVDTGSKEVSMRLMSIESEMRQIQQSNRQTEGNVVPIRPNTHDIAVNNANSEITVESLQPEIQEGDVPFSRIQSQWDSVVEAVKKRKRSTQAFLMEGQPIKVVGNVLTIEFRSGFSFHRDKIDQPENKLTIEAVLREMFRTLLLLRL